jgi:hypothetical protein
MDASCGKIALHVGTHKPGVLYVYLVPSARVVTAGHAVHVFDVESRLYPALQATVHEVVVVPFASLTVVTDCVDAGSAPV